jgi:hypothetical protein
MLAEEPGATAVGPRPRGATERALARLAASTAWAAERRASSTHASGAAGAAARADLPSPRAASAAFLRRPPGAVGAEAEGRQGTAERQPAVLPTRAARETACARPPRSSAGGRIASSPRSRGSRRCTRARAPSARTSPRGRPGTESCVHSSCSDPRSSHHSSLDTTAAVSVCKRAYGASMWGAIQSRAKSPTVATTFTSVSFFSGGLPGLGSSHCQAHSSAASHLGTFS